MIIKKNNINGVHLDFPNDLKDLQNCIAVMNEKKVEVITASKNLIKDDIFNLDFLDSIEYPLSVKEILVNGYHNTEPLYRFKNVEIFGGEPSEGEFVDLAKFPKLNELYASTLQGFVNLDKCFAKKVSLGDLNRQQKICYEKLRFMPNLSDLRIYPATNFKFQKISELTNLKIIVLTNGNYKDLDGIEKLTNLKFAWICDNRSLLNIKGISKNKSLNRVYIENCCKLSDLSELGEMEQIIDLRLENIKNCNFSFLEKLTNLRRLGLFNCGEIPSLKFVNKLSQLKSMSIYKTNVLDGDLSPLKPMKFVFISDKRHYNLKSKDFVNEGNYSWSANIEDFL